jgi:hypothetical protein
MEKIMRSMIPAMLIATGVVISSSVVAGAEPVTTGRQIFRRRRFGRARPRADDFAPDSQSNQPEQNRLPAFDARQQKLDEMLKTLNICRG